MQNYLTAFLILLPSYLFATAEFYRVSWRSDPATSAVICWHQASGSDPELCYDTVDHQQKATAYAHRAVPTRTEEYREMNNHFVRLENLKPDTAYYFVVCDSEGTGRRLWFKTAPAEPKPFTFIVGGDSRTNPDARREGNRLVAKLRPLFILFGGDYTIKGTAEQWRQWFEDWQLTISEDGRIYPIIVTHGNHENADLQMMTRLFDSPNPDQYYSLGVGGDMMRIWALNSELEYKDAEKVPAQNAWIRNDLAAHPDVAWKVATYHRPMRPHTAHKTEGENRIKWWAQLFYEQGVDLVVESDTHMVKRSYPVRPSDEADSYESFIRDDEKGMVFIGEGSWGAPARPANDDKPWTMASDSFHQFKWVQAFPDELLIRTVRFDDAEAAVPLTENNLFEAPENIRFWEPESGTVLRLPFDPSHPTYTEPVKPETIFDLGQNWEWSLNGIDWAEGQAPLGYGDDKVRTVITEGDEKPLKAAFRKSFAVENVDDITKLFIDVQVDDGCVIILNDKEVLRRNMPEGDIGPETLASKRVFGGSEKRAVTLPVEPNHLQNGTNVFEVMTFQNAPDSSDLIFDLRVRIKR